MEKDQIRPEWIPSAYSGIDKPEKKENIKPGVNNNKAVAAKRSFARKKAK